MSKPKLYIFIGSPGAGKTTVATFIHELTGAVHLWADHERNAMFGTVTHSKLESDTLYAHLNQMTDELLATGHSVIFDTNFNYKKDRDYLATLARAHDAETLIVWLQTPINIARERALHHTHRDRNGYDQTMTIEEFTRLTNHLETPSDNENFITIDGSNIDKVTVAKHLGIND